MTDMIGIWTVDRDYDYETDTWGDSTLEFSHHDNGDQGTTTANFWIDGDIGTIDLPKQLGKLTAKTGEKKVDRVHIVFEGQTWSRNSSYRLSTVPFDPTEWGCSTVGVFNDSDVSGTNKRVPEDYLDGLGAEILDASSSFETLERVWLHNGVVTQTLVDRLCAAPKLESLEVVHRNTNMKESLHVPVPANKDGMEVWGFDFCGTSRRHTADGWQSKTLRQVAYNYFDFSSDAPTDTLCNGNLSALILDDSNIDTDLSFRIADAQRNSELEWLVLSNNERITQLPFMGTHAHYHTDVASFGRRCKCRRHGERYLTTTMNIKYNIDSFCRHTNWVDHLDYSCRHNVPTTTAVECLGLTNLEQTHYPQLSGLSNQTRGGKELDRHNLKSRGAIFDSYRTA